MTNNKQELRALRLNNKVASIEDLVIDFGSQAPPILKDGRLWLEFAVLE